MFDPLNALASFVLGKLKQTMVSQWLKLLFTLSFTGGVSFLFVCGTILGVEGKLLGAIHGFEVAAAILLAVGGGMVASAVCMVRLFRSSPLTKGMMVVLPSEEAGKEMDTPMQSIERNDKS